MSTIPAGFRLPAVGGIARAQGAPALTGPSGPASPAPIASWTGSATPDFKADLAKATAMAPLDRDRAVNLYWTALRSSKTLDETLSLVDAVMAPKRGYNDIRVAALNKVIERIETREQAMEVARTLHAKGHYTDAWTVGALRKGLELSKTPAEAKEIATFAQENGRYMRYRTVLQEALAKAEG